MVKLYCLLICLFLFSTVQANSIETIQLKYRSAESLLPVLEPLLDQNSHLSGTGYLLFLKASEQETNNILQLVRQLDTPLKQLMISVFQGTERELTESSNQFSVIFQKQHHRRPHLDFKFSTRNNHSISRNNPIHQLKILEGYSGYIETGKSIPFFSTQVWQDNYGRRVYQSSTQYRDLLTGFYVLPRLAEDKVSLEISPYNNTLSNNHPDRINTQSMSTTLTGALGQWLEIGGQNTQSSSQGNQTGGHYKTREQQSSHVWVRADIIH
ncbi:MAG: hypothetical protein V3W04_11385 [Gammaproteobacteria bacterium]